YLGGVPGPQVGRAAAEAVRSSGPDAGAVLQQGEVGGRHGGGVHGAPWVCQAAGGLFWSSWHWHQ
ncbi:hypothetical protein HaLaN_29180, partial [Haematococcus lacustris]